MDSNLHIENVRLARRMAVQHQSPVTIWHSGKLDNIEYVRVGSPEEDAEAARQGWYWITIVRPPR